LTSGGFRIVSDTLVIVVVRSSAVAERPRDAPCHWKFCCHSRSPKVNEKRVCC